MKKTLALMSMVASIGVINSAQALAKDVGAVTFQWSGIVPIADKIETGYWIVTPDGDNELTVKDNGRLQFENKNGEISLKSSSAFSFKVVKDVGNVGTFEPTTDIEGISYKLALNDLKVLIDGSPDSSVDYFAIQADSQTLSKLTPQEFTANQVADVKVTKSGAPGSSFTQANANDNITVMAMVAISTDTI
ncbi:hypothetical protein [Vibrio sp. AND4]|uniref:hypothetical protein n=1 Tax=Vibrio sp. AND4 TaxID=314289 RepID=UPI00015F3193|nr:hypothetical protein [Vibrio sp. AND4]EDP60462.1 hypothetical protein AND4_06079 [Vibrio sp. AND4]